MRVLILSVFLACAAAAPSFPAPVVTFLQSPLFRAPLVVPVALPTVSSGDVQAAVIDAQVKAEDQARAFADQARELAEHAAENQNEGVIEANDLAKERSEQAFWSAEEQKWQALDAQQVAAAQADAAAAKTAYVPYEEPAAAPENAAEAMPVAEAKAAETPAVNEAAEVPVAPEAPKVEEQPAVKMAESEKPVEAEKPADNVQVESADLKSAAPEPVKIESPFLVQPFHQGSVFGAPLSIAPLGYNQPLVAPVAYFQPGFKAVAAPAIHPIPGHFVAPQVLPHQW